MTHRSTRYTPPIAIGNNRYEVVSHSKAGLKYTVTIDPMPTPPIATCTCVGYGYRGDCSHIKETLQWLLTNETQQAAYAATYAAMTNAPLEVVEAAAPTPPTLCDKCGAKLPATHAAHGICPACIRRATFGKGGYFED